MQELLLVNPARRPKKRRTTASPAQKRARAKFAAMARARSGTAKKRRTKRSTSTTAVVMSNPAPRRHRRRSVAAKVTRRSKRRSKPISLGSVARKPLAMLTPALMGAIGATAVNTILGKLPVPAMAMTGKMKYLTQGVAAIALATIASKLGIKGAMAAQMAEGSLTVTMHQAIVDIAGGMGMNLSGMGYYLPGIRASAIPSRAANPGQLMGVNGMGRYLTGPGARQSMTPQVSARSGLKGFNR